MKKAILGIVIICVLLLGTACSGTVEQTNEQLTIYAQDELEHDITVYTNVVENYKSKYPTVDVQIYEGNSDETMTSDAEQSALKAAMASGNGPDILLGLCSSQDVEKLAKSHLFYDINELLKKDTEFKLDETYQENVLEAGVFNDERLVIPLFFTMNTFTSTDEILSKSNLKGLTTYTAQEFCDNGNLFLDENESMALFVDQGENYQNVINAAFPVLDEKTLESDAFVDLLQLCRRNMERQEALGLDAENLGRPYFSLESGKYLFYVSSDNTAVNHLGVFSGLGQATFFNIENDDGGLNGNVMVFVAINAKSHNLENAWNFIKVLLTEYLDVQKYEPEIKKTTSMYGEQGATVLLSGNDAIVNRLQEKEIPNLNYLNSDGSVTQIPLYPIRNEVAQAYKNLPRRVTKVGYCLPFNSVIQYFDPYIAGEKSLEDCLDEAKNYVRIHAEE